MTAALTLVGIGTHVGHNACHVHSCAARRVATRYPERNLVGNPIDRVSCAWGWCDSADVLRAGRCRLERADPYTVGHAVT